jgi:hypothetical protein
MVTEPAANIDELVRQMMEAYAQDAVQGVRDGYGVELDFSPESLQQVEEILGKIHGGIRKGWFWRLVRLETSEEQIETLCKIFGGYLGEVIRKQAGGEWRITDSPGGEGTILTLQKGDDRIFPASKVYKRLTNGAEDDVWFYYQAMMEADLFGKPPEENGG